MSTTSLRALLRTGLPASSPASGSGETTEWKSGAGETALGGGGPSPIRSLTSLFRSSLSLARLSEGPET